MNSDRVSVCVCMCGNIEGKHPITQCSDAFPQCFRADPFNVAFKKKNKIIESDSGEER